MTSILSLAQNARRAASELRSLDRGRKDRALRNIATRLRQEIELISEHNGRDLEAARNEGLSSAMLDRLRMNAEVTEASARGVEFIASLPDPVGSIESMQRHENGMLFGRQRVPLGVIAMIYESRPNVTVDAAALCLKSGNAVLLRGGKEAAHTNRALGEVLSRALTESGFPGGAVQIVPAADREEIREMLSLTDYIDLAIPRGGEGLIRFVAENARVPVIKHYKGVCHLFLDRGSPVDRAVQLTLNSKVQRPSACNALECLLVDAADAERLLPPVAEALLAQGVEIRGCPRTLALVSGARAAADSDWGKEFLDNVIAVKVVADINEALEHVARYGSNHTEAISTSNQGHAQRWLREVDACCVLVNASTRFNDGGQLGLGAEIGISTSKLHAYGPMGLSSLTTEKWIVVGEGQVRA